MFFKFKIKNFKLALLALCFITLFTSLGCWQLARAKQKELLLQTFHERTLHAPLSAKNISEINDWRFYRTILSGKFDTQHTFLLDNKIVNGQVGYEIYTPFMAEGLKSPILVDRGFIPLGASRNILPKINTSKDSQTLEGMLNLAPAYVAFGPMQESSSTWPLRVEFINISQLNQLLNTTLFPYILTLQQNQPAAYAIEWQITSIPPERHRGYAVQWFALALTLLILFVALNRDRANA